MDFATGGIQGNFYGGSMAGQRFDRKNFNLIIFQLFFFISLNRFEWNEKSIKSESECWFTVNKI